MNWMNGHYLSKGLRVKNASRKGRKDAKEDEIHGGLIYSCF